MLISYVVLVGGLQEFSAYPRDWSLTINIIFLKLWSDEFNRPKRLPIPNLTTLFSVQTAAARSPASAPRGRPWAPWTPPTRRGGRRPRPRSRRRKSWTSWKRGIIKERHRYTRQPLRWVNTYITAILLSSPHSLLFREMLPWCANCWEWEQTLMLKIMQVGH